MNTTTSARIPDAGDAGAGLHAAPKFMAQISAAIDEYIAEAAEGSPARAIEAMVGLGLVKTVELVCGTGPLARTGGTWAELDQRIQRQRQASAAPVGESTS